MKRSRLMVTALIVISGALPATAQDGNIAAQPAEKSPSTATNASLIGTLVPIIGGILLLGNEDTQTVGLVISGAGLAIGPGLGHIYAHNQTQMATGMAIRVVSGTVALAALSEVEIFANEGNSGPFMLFLAGSTVCLGSAAHDIVFARKSAEQYNRSISRAGMSVRPAYFPRQSAVGLSVSLRF